MAKSISKCSFGAAACIGGNGTGNALCAVGYTGPLCAVCASGHIMNTFGHVCDHCSHRPTPVAIVLIILSVILVFIMSWRLLNLGGEMVLLNLAAYTRTGISHRNKSHVWWKPSQWLWKCVACVINRLTWVREPVCLSIYLL